MARFYSRPDPTAAEKLARLATRIANTPSHRLAALTPEQLARETGAPMREAEYRLRSAQQSGGGA